MNERNEERKGEGVNKERKVLGWIERRMEARKECRKKERKRGRKKE
jgi:hypothetical protein